MEKSNNRLGRGLDSLITNSEKSSDISREIDITEIVPNLNQPRKKFDKDKMEELNNSVKENGILQPIIVREIDDGYEIIAGERRYKAALEVELKTIPVIIKEVDDDKSLELAIIENIQREDLNPVEEAKGFKVLLETYNYTQEKLAKKLGKSRTAITNILRLLKLPDAILDFLENQEISPGHARAILTLKSKDEQVKLAKKAVKQKLSVREIERIVKRKESIKKQVEETPIDSETIDMESKLRNYLGTKVKLKGVNKNKGKLEIEYYSKGDLERIVETIGMKDSF